MTRTEIAVGKTVIMVAYDKKSGNTLLGITYRGPHGSTFAKGEIAPESVAGVISVLREGGDKRTASPGATSTGAR